jgi:hypothetical protein
MRVVSSAFALIRSGGQPNDAVAAHPLLRQTYAGENSVLSPLRARSAKACGLVPCCANKLYR